MRITYINKNFLIPEIIEYQNLADAIDKLYETTHNQNSNYNENIYVVHSSLIYFVTNNTCYSLNTKTNNIDKYDTNTKNIDCLNLINNFRNNIIINIPVVSDEMNLVIKNTNGQKIF